MQEKLVQLHADFARRVAELSHCQRAGCACVLTSVDGESIYAFGYNGSWRGGPNACTGPVLPGKCECVHAEANALVKWRPDARFVAFVSTSPCASCAKLLINARCETVYAGAKYRDDAGLLLLSSASVSVRFT